MKKNLLFLCLLIATIWQVNGQMIRLSTNETDLILEVAPNGRLYQSYLGARLINESDLTHFSPYLSSAASDAAVSLRGWEVYPGSGAEDYFEPAFAIQHADGNMTTILTYDSHQTNKIDDNATETVIYLSDKVYPVKVALYFQTFAKENIFKSWSIIEHQENKPITMTQYASSMLYFEEGSYYQEKNGQFPSHLSNG